jgi:hypothetical protein
VIDQALRFRPMDVHVPRWVIWAAVVVAVWFIVFEIVMPDVLTQL